MRGCLLMLAAGCAGFAQTWISHPSGTKASLRGVSALDANTVWASGTGGAYLVTRDGGLYWRVAVVPGANKSDFRAVRAITGETAYLMSIGTGEQSRIYRTGDAGGHWTLLYTNPDSKGSFDAMAFWDARHGIVVGDQVQGHMTVFTTADGGRHWARQHTPPALDNEGAFAASNSCLFVLGATEAWFATGGAGAARVFHSVDGGRNWSAAVTPMRNDAPSAGIFSLAFSDTRHGVAVGGDYTKPGEASHNVAVTSDGGRTWTEPSGAHPNGFRSAVAFLADRGCWIAVGTSGSDVSCDNGASWKPFDTGAYNAISFVSSRAGWAVGPQGRLAEFRWMPAGAKRARRAP